MKFNITWPMVRNYIPFLKPCDMVLVPTKEAVRFSKHLEKAKNSNYYYCNLQNAHGAQYFGEILVWRKDKYGIVKETVDRLTKEHCYDDNEYIPVQKHWTKREDYHPTLIKAVKDAINESKNGHQQA